MKNANPLVDSYIDEAADFAQPLLVKIRKAFHDACPDIEEEIKWGTPCFCKEGIVGGMAAFKRHVSLGFWRARELELGDIELDRTTTAMIGSLKVSSLKELPSLKSLKALIKQAVALNIELASAPKSKKKATKKKVDKPVLVPDVLAAALKKNKLAQKNFEALSPSCKREYIEWITEAKRDETRDRRLATTLEWVAEGRTRNWKYKNC